MGAGEDKEAGEDNEADEDKEAAETEQKQPSKERTRLYLSPEKEESLLEALTHIIAAWSGDYDTEERDEEDEEGVSTPTSSEEDPPPPQPPQWGMGYGTEQPSRG